MPTRFQPLISTPPPLPRDPATDQSTLVDRQAIGLAVTDPETGVLVETVKVSLGRSTRTTSMLTKTGRPGFWKSRPFIVQARNLSAAAPVAFAPGTLRGNTIGPIVGLPSRGLYDRVTLQAASPAGPPVGLTGVVGYLLSSLHLMLARPNPAVVSGQANANVTPGPAGQHAHVMGAPASGFPVIAPRIPSYGSRIPLLRPPTLITNA